MIEGIPRKVGSNEALPVYQAGPLRAEKVLQVGMQKVGQSTRATQSLDPSWLPAIGDTDEQGPYKAPHLGIPGDTEVETAVVIITRRVQADIDRGRPDPINQGAALLGVPPSRLAPVVQEGIRSLLPADQRWQAPLPPTLAGVLTNGSVNPVNGNLYNPPVEPLYGQLNNQSPTIQPPLPREDKHGGFWKTLLDVAKVLIPIAIGVLLFTPAGAPLLAGLGGSLGGLLSGLLQGGLGNLLGGLGKIGLGDLLGGLGKIGLPGLGDLLGGLGKLGLPNLGNLLGGIGNLGLPGIGNFLRGGLPNLGNLTGLFRDLPGLGDLAGIGDELGQVMRGGLPNLGPIRWPGLGGITDGLFRGLPGLGDELLTGGSLDIGKLLLRGGPQGTFLFSLLGELLKLLFRKHKDQEEPSEPPPGLPPATPPQWPSFPVGGPFPGQPISGPVAGTPVLPPWLGWGGEGPGPVEEGPLPIGPGLGDVIRYMPVLPVGQDEPEQPPVYSIQPYPSRPVDRPDKVEKLPELLVIVTIVNQANAGKRLSFEDIGRLVDLLGRRGILPDLDDRNRWVFVYPPAGQAFTGQEVVDAIRRIPGSLIEQQPVAPVTVT